MSATDFIETELGLLPKSWFVKPLGEICEKPTYGYTDSSSKSGNAKFLRITDITDNGVNWDEVPFCNCPDEKLKNYLLKDDDIVFARIGATTGKSYIIKNPPVAVYASYLIRVRAREAINSQFLYYFFKSQAYWQQVDANKKSNLKQGVNGSILQKLLIPTPNKEEQRKISNILALVQSAIQKQEQIINTSTELKNALMKRLFTKGMNNESLKETVIGMVPESWEVLDLEKTGDVIYGIQAAVANNTKPIGTKILTNVNINLDGNINLTKTRYYQLKSKRDFNTILKRGDILFNWRSGSKEHVGKTALFNLDGEYIHSSFILRIRPNEKIDNEFLFYYLFQLRQSGYFMRMQDYSINAKFNKSAINKLPVAVPTLEEQRFISKAINSANLKLEHHTKKLNNLQSLFQTMLQQLMTGKLRLENTSSSHNAVDSENVKPVKLSA